MSQNIKNNIAQIQQTIDNALIKSGRPQGSVALLAVSKFHPQQEVLDAINCGQLLFGENRVQEAYQKFMPILEQNKNVKLHIIGQLQRNKVKHAVQIACCIESVDRIELLDEIEKQCTALNKSIDILFEYHTGEESKSGFTDKQQIIQALNNFKQGKYPHINPAGFMTMAPFTEDKTLIRKSFITLRELSKELQEAFPEYNLNELSMGMSSDYQIAIEEGSTLVRVGTAIFGPREY